MTPKEGRDFIFRLNPDAEIIYTPWRDFDGNVVGDHVHSPPDLRRGHRRRPPAMDDRGHRMSLWLLIGLGVVGGFLATCLVALMVEVFVRIIWFIEDHFW